MHRMHRTALAVVAGVLFAAPAAHAAGPATGSPADPAAKKFVEAISVDKMVQHQQALQDIADANDGTREVFSSGYQASVDYVKNTLTAAGYDAKIDQFNFPFWEETADPVLSLNNGTPYTPGTAEDDGSPDVDFITMANSHAIDLNDVPVVPVDVVDPPGTKVSTSGCEESDYANVDVSGKVALLQRGTCAFVDKWALAEDHGAVGVVIYNEGNNATRQNPIFVDNGIDTEIAAVITSYATGNEILQSFKRGENPTVDFKVSAQFTDRFLPQVITETKTGDPDNVVVVGAHLDSVPAGPGINDDGSGTAMLLTMAQELAKPKYHLKQKIRFAWWGAEEEGLVGSQYYAHNLSDAEVAKIDVMLDYDMLASPNYIRSIYDGDGTAGADNPAGPAGSGLVEAVHERWFAAQGMATSRVPFDGRSDYVGFTDEGIPAGGVFAGAEGVKTPQEEAVYGGDAGSWYDPCYHQPCDNIDTVTTGIPPAQPVAQDGAEGLEFRTAPPFATTAEREAAAAKMAGGSLKGFKELAGASAYATWYFSNVSNAFSQTGAGAKAQAKRAAVAKRSSKRIDALGHAQIGN